MDKEFEVDLESGVVVSDEDSSNTRDSGVKGQGKTWFTKFYGGFSDGLIKADERVSCGITSDIHGVVSPHNVEALDGEVVVNHVEKTAVKEKRKKSSNKKASKPPRPPRGPSLDAADQKLIKEISDLAMLKRARVERMKALKKMKGAKASSNSNMFAMLFTILFCLVIIFHGISSRRTSPLSFQGSPASAGATEGGVISVQFYTNPSASISNGPGSESSNIVEQVSGSDLPQKLRSAG